MPTITVVNGYKTNWNQYAISKVDKQGNTIKTIRYYIGRKNKKLNLNESPLANKFKLKNYNKKSREQVISLHKDSLNSYLLHKSSNVYRIIYKLAQYYLLGWNIELVCYCAPLKCHGDSIKEAILTLAEEIKNLSK